MFTRVSFLLLCSQLGTLHILEAMKDAGHDIRTLFLCGGLSKNALFVQIHANATGTKTRHDDVPHVLYLTWRSAPLTFRVTVLRIAGGAAGPDGGRVIRSSSPGCMCIPGVQRHTGGVTRTYTKWKNHSRNLHKDGDKRLNVLLWGVSGVSLCALKHTVLMSFQIFM